MPISEEAFAALAAEVRHLRDRQEILDCINLYGRGLDRLDAGLIRNAYHPDAIDQHGPFLGSVDEFVPFAIEIEGSFVATHHGITSHNCEIDGDEAHAESYVYFFVVQPGGQMLGSGYGRYIDRLERRHGKWALSVRRLVMDCGFEIARSGWLGAAWDEIRAHRDPTDMSYERPLQPPKAASL